MYMNDLKNIIDIIERFILNNYPNIYLSKKDSFIGGKFKSTNRFFLFYVNLYNDKLYLVSRENYLLKQYIKIIKNS